MVIEVTEFEFVGLSPAELAACHIIPALTSRHKSIAWDTAATTITMNAWFRGSIKAAIGRDYYVQSGPVETLPSGRPPADAQRYSIKGTRRAMEQKGGAVGMSDLEVRACADWSLDKSGERMMDRYVGLDEDHRLDLFRKLYGVPKPPPRLVMPYAGQRPPYLADIGVVPVDSWNALKEWAVVKITSAFPTYNRGSRVDAATMISRMEQLRRAFACRPAPTLGSFSMHPWGIVPASDERLLQQTAPSQTAMQFATQLMVQVVPSLTADVASKEVALAASIAIAVSLAAFSSSSEAAAISHLARVAATCFDLPSSLRLQEAARAASSSACHHAPENWPSVMVAVARAFVAADISASTNAEIVNMLSRLSLSAKQARASSGSVYLLHVTAQQGAPACVAASRAPCPPQPPLSSLFQPAAAASRLGVGGGGDGVSIQSAAAAAPTPGPPQPPLSSPFQPAAAAALLGVGGGGDGVSIQSAEATSPAPGLSRASLLSPTQTGFGVIASGAGGASLLRTSMFSVIPAPTPVSMPHVSAVAASQLVLGPSRNGSFAVSGTGTFILKDYLRALGFWNHQVRAWIIPDRNRVLLNEIVSGAMGSGAAAQIAPLASMPLSRTSALDSGVAHSGPAALQVNAAQWRVPRISIDAPTADTPRPLALPIDGSATAAMEGIFPRYLLWHGQIDGWAALRLVTRPDDSTYVRGSTTSKIRVVCEAIDAAVGIHVVRGQVFAYGVPIVTPTLAHLEAAHRFVMGIEAAPATSSWYKYYKSLKTPQASSAVASSAIASSAAASSASAGSKRMRE